MREGLLGLRACANTVSMAVVVRRISELKMRHRFNSRVNNCNSNANAHQQRLMRHGVGTGNNLIRMCTVHAQIETHHR